MAGMKAKIFDFDNTLAVSDSRVYITKPNGKKLTLTPGEYSHYVEEPGDKFDFREFHGDNLINPREIKKYTAKLRNALQAGSARVFILTARGNTKPIARFLSDIGIRSGVTIVCLNNSAPEKKRAYIAGLLHKGFDDIDFWDDATPYIDAVNQLKNEFPNAKIHTHRIPETAYMHL